MKKHKLLTSFAAAAVLTSTAVPAVNNLPIVKTQTVKAATAADQQAFITNAATHATKVAKKYGLYPSVMIAQAILESGWGESGLATQANNLFGIKAGAGWMGETYTAKTREENSKGKSYYITASFKKYPTYEGSFEDNAILLRNGILSQGNRYQGTWIENANSYTDATSALTGTYATDHSYDKKLNEHITKYNLTQYDPTISKVSKSYTVGKNASTYAWPTDHSVSAKSGSVKAGESVTVDKTITYKNGSKRMHIAGKGWVNSTVFKKNSGFLASSQAPAATTAVKKQLMHNAYMYDKKGKKLAGSKKLAEDTVINTYGTKTIKGKKYYRVGKDAYVAAGNIDGTMRYLKRNSYVYNGSGNRDNNIVHHKNDMIATFGSSVNIMGHKYYKVGIHQYIKASNFVK
ncbi:glucosaminidase domain-containing protein [Lactobacillus xujianguonis]|uniref:glucosaminidase domain-containing protein n=1 Tax=Lactobacillus xujianguonis TaxID=2495899 RepID=UPI000FDC1236|nr:glucosaminidase domain-containing protein [Lactobacillus xujianguonis]RVU73497.1 N-acetylmuramidase [Lactobacillus xujianguonis]